MRYRPILLCGLALLPVIAFKRSQNREIAAGGSQINHAPLPAPTFYLVVDERCGGDEVEVRGASNLPAGAIIDLSVADFKGDGWTYYSDEVNATVGEDGFFSANIPLKQVANMPHNLIVTAAFGTVYHHQPQNMLKAVGRHGENLDDFKNPQAYAVSGFNTTLQTIARAPCGPYSK